MTAGPGPGAPGREGYRGRFAPSPTGSLHLGAARTAFVAWLRARSLGGTLVLRWDDLDTARIRPGSRESIEADLLWLGLHWDGRPVAQSGRISAYEAAFERLRDLSLVYPCSCSRRDLAESLSAPHGEEEPLYPGNCRNGPTRGGRPLAWRFRMDRVRPVEDLLWGPQPGLRDDFVVRRADGTFSYQFACAFDDLDLGVTEVVRGADLLGSASRQGALAEAWGGREPAWLHLPLLLGPDGTRLSKRHGSVAVSDYRAAGWSPERVLGLLAASLGWCPVGTAPSLGEWLERWEVGALPMEEQRFQGPWPG